MSLNRPTTPVRSRLDVTTGDMVKICHENRGEDLINKLVDKAKEGGGTDNITATVIY